MTSTQTGSPHPSAGRLFARIGTWLCAALLAAPALADGQHVFWEVAGRHNTVYLLGSVHLLHASDRALPPVTDAAYADAETIVEEIDLFAAASEMLSPAALAQQMLPEGQTLRGVLGDALHARLVEAVRPLGIDPDFLTRMQPWFVALQITQLKLQKAGFSAADGVDLQIAMRARSDGKPLRGLETATEQLGMLSSMTLPEQREFLRATLDEPDTPDALRRITDAWRRGDLAALETLLRQGAAESPAFYRRLITDRNLRWMPAIEQMLADPRDDYLVVTGAAHMVGEQGLVELLRRKGYKVTRK